MRYFQCFASQDVLQSDATRMASVGRIFAVATVVNCARAQAYRTVHGTAPAREIIAEIIAEKVCQLFVWACLAD